MGALSVRSQFDQNADGKLDDNERARARSYVQSQREGGRGFPGGGPRGPRQAPQAGRRVAIDDVPHVADETDLYDESVLRTLFLEFGNAEWEAELADFWKTDIDVPAQLTVDGNAIGEVGLRFRGTSSFFTVAPGQKRSFNLAIDYGAPKQRLFGYKTLNLLNGHTDPTFLRTVLFNHIARHYVPAPKANYVHVVINGESWGIYVNVQQFNKDFQEEWFGSKAGIRWKMLPNPRGGNGLGYDGNQFSAYEGRYQMKSVGGDDAWASLIEVFRVLNETPPEQLEAALEPIMDIDRALWFLALENTFIDNDGYWVRASDFSMLTDRRNRLHMILHDSNETFRSPGGPGYNGGGDGVKLDPLFGLNEPTKPLIHRLLQVPALKARYLAHVQTLADEWLDWKKLQPLVEQYQTLIGDEIARDTRKHASTDDFYRGATEDLETEGFRGRRKTLSIRNFVTQRAAYFADYAAFQKPTPEITAVRYRGEETERPLPHGTIILEATVKEEPAPSAVFAYVSDKREGVFERFAMEQQSPGTYRARISGKPAGERIRYYVEARNETEGTARFYPRTAAFRPPSFRIEPEAASQSPIVISELMPSNTTTLADEQADFDDWIELQNVSDQPVDLSGCFLSDNPKNPRKWRIPDATSLQPGAVLLVWADEDGKDPGFHANFKLSQKGETIALYDRDEKQNQQLDQVTYPKLGDNEAWGRSTTGSNNFERLDPTPGHPNP